MRARAWLSIAMLAVLLPALAQPLLSITRAEFGLFRPDGTLLPTTSVPHAVDQAYGWRLRVDTRLATLRVHEELTLPAAPATWGDPEPGLKRRVSADGRTVITELTLVPQDGQVSQAWAVAPGDPKGEYLLKVKLEGAPEQVFRFRVQ